jgi:hypothetical protein
MDLRNTLILLVFLSAFLTGTVVSTAPRAAQRDDRVAAEDMAREAIEQLMRALELMIQSIPQYEMPEIEENGDIIIRRKHPTPDPEPREPENPDVPEVEETTI